MRVIVLALAVVLSACVSATVSKKTFNSEGAANGGVVSYLNQGASFVVNSRRADAEKKMTDICGGPFKISQEDTGGQYVANSYANYTYITFSCN